VVFLWVWFFFTAFVVFLSDFVESDPFEVEFETSFMVLLEIVYYFTSTVAKVWFFADSAG
jgi:hypothetical protein